MVGRRRGGIAHELFACFSAPDRKGQSEKNTPTLVWNKSDSSSGSYSDMKSESKKSCEAQLQKGKGGNSGLPMMLLPV
ncbi:hypothetical protein AMECASPLE_016167 [Ameca splendens]|uniref:Uncharacterized protein n=1 Tax=Ameca splendens TaxID=208324 RepID=A0ABV0ZM69_9TELE